MYVMGTPFVSSVQVKLGQHAYSCLFGTFLGNSMKEREAWRLAEETTPIWVFLHQDNLDVLNYLYSPPKDKQEVKSERVLNTV